MNGMVGPARLELATSRLSSVRSNQLSYEPLLKAIAIQKYRELVSYAGKKRYAGGSAMHQIASLERR